MQAMHLSDHNGWSRALHPHLRVSSIPLDRNCAPLGLSLVAGRDSLLPATAPQSLHAIKRHCHCLPLPYIGLKYLLFKTDVITRNHDKYSNTYI